MEGEREVVGGPLPHRPPPLSRPISSCAQQRDWGTCSKPWMAGYCDRTCGRCTCDCPCADAPPRADTSCRTHADWGQCDVEEHPWRASCAVTCGRCGKPGCAPPAPSSGAGVCARGCHNTLVPLAETGIPGVDLSVAAPITRTSPFVAAAGRRLTLGGAPWFFGGTNMYSLPITDWWNDTMVSEGGERGRRGGRKRRQQPTTPAPLLRSTPRSARRPSGAPPRPACLRSPTGTAARRTATMRQR